MKLAKIPAGTYVIAVSGGVDSVVLLDMLVKKHGNAKLIAAHVDHGIRADSGDDAQFVAGLAETYGLQFEQCELSLGSGGGETEARQKRYEFLRNAAEKHRADGIITAHHADDIIETVVLNVLRGTGWRGLCSLRSGEILRPMAGVYKNEILAYAHRQKLEWCEDVTNRDRRYLRNRIRRDIIPRAAAQDSAFKEKIYQLSQRQCGLRGAIEAELSTIAGKESLPKQLLVSVEEQLAVELLRHFLLQHNVRQTRPQLRRAYAFVQAAENGKQFSLNAQQSLRLKAGELVVITG